MITIEKEFTFEETYPLSRLGNRDELLFFDIETTGFSGDYNNVYLIGCVFFDRGSARFIQWFADTRSSETEVIESFFDFSKNYKTLVHFNGDTFDIPFIEKRVHALGLSHSFDRLKSIDIYKLIKPYKKHLGLENLKQKSIEAFLGIDRDDKYTGGQLIEVYQEYLKTKDQFLLNLLLLHNEDDLKGMPKLLPILHYPDFLNGTFTLVDLKKAAGETPRVMLALECDPETVLPVPIAASVPSYALKAAENRMLLSIRLYEGTLKYYYPNYKDYYYLIYEDTAIHKSVGEYVDRDAKIKATKETCYTKKTGVFLPQSEPFWTPDFKNTCKDKTCFFEFCPDCFSDHEALNRYIHRIIKDVFTAR
ncbi:MAG: ribonuclease H-like domain-containing protein [Lachnospiraceae bacterium]|nr:ribonuclease H-like domain-containing protein [Lachnospiraceae bacterium]